MPAPHTNADARTVVASYSDFQRLALALPVSNQLDLIAALTMGELSELDANYDFASAVDAAREELREMDAASDPDRSDPYFAGSFGFERPGLAA